MSEDPGDWDEDCGDRNGEPSEEDYELGCVVLALAVGMSMGAVIILLVLVTLR